MVQLNLTTAFNRYGAKLVNPQWAVSAISGEGELVVSCWTHYLKAVDGKLVYTDHLSRWSGNSAGKNLMRLHLEEAVAGNLSVRMVKETTSDRELVDSGGVASQTKNTFGVRPDLIGHVVLFDGDDFVIELIRDQG